MAKSQTDKYQVNVSLETEDGRHLAALAKVGKVTATDLARASIRVLLAANPMEPDAIEAALGEEPATEINLPTPRGGKPRRVTRKELLDVGRGEAKPWRPSKTRRSVDQPIQQDPAHPDAPAETSGDSDHLPEASAQAA